MNNILKVKNVSKSYFKNKVLDDINLDIEAGKIITILGPNGVGKSTLLRILGGKEQADDGVVELNGENIQKFNFSQAGSFGFVDEKLEYNFPYSIKELAELLGATLSDWDQDYFDYLIEKRGIDSSKNYLQCSRGQKMQISLMIELAKKAKLLLLDEITSVIDVYGRKFLLDELNNFKNEGGTVLISTNIINELDFYTDQLIILKDSKVKLNEDIKEIDLKFIKLRFDKSSDHEVLNDPDCIWAGVNSDLTISYIIPKESSMKYSIPGGNIDRRKFTLEDIFIYFFDRRSE